MNVGHLVPEVIAGLLDGVEDCLAEPLTLGHHLFGHHLVLLGVGVPGLGNYAPKQIVLFGIAVTSL